MRSSSTSPSSARHPRITVHLLVILCVHFRKWYEVFNRGRHGSRHPPPSLPHLLKGYYSLRISPRLTVYCDIVHWCISALSVFHVFHIIICSLFSLAAAATSSEEAYRKFFCCSQHSFSIPNEVSTQSSPTGAQLCGDVASRGTHVGYLENNVSVTVGVCSQQGSSKFLCNITLSHRNSCRCPNV